MGADRTSTSSPRTINLFLLHFVQSLRERYPSAVLVYAIERNMSNIDANRIGELVMRFRPAHVLCYDEDTEDGGMGVTTTERSKRFMADRVVDLLANDKLRKCANLIRPFDEWLKMQSQEEMDQKGVSIDIRGIEKTATSSSSSSGKTLPPAIRMLDTQISEYRRDTVMPKNTAHGTAKVIYTGKSSTKYDDLVMAFQIAILHMDICLGDPTFRIKMMNKGVVLPETDKALTGISKL